MANGNRRNDAGAADGNAAESAAENETDEHRAFAVRVTYRLESIRARRHGGDRPACQAATPGACRDRAVGIKLRFLRMGQASE
jgi:hypothetical protein